MSLYLDDTHLASCATVLVRGSHLHHRSAKDHSGPQRHGTCIVCSHVERTTRALTLASRSRTLAYAQDKILQSMGNQDEVTVTNDGATILKSLNVDNPAAKVLIGTRRVASDGWRVATDHRRCGTTAFDADISKTQDSEVGDGTTSVCVFAGELLREGEKLLKQHIHPQTIIHGWRLATEAAKQRLADLAEDNSSDDAKFRQDLVNIAKTTLSSKLLNQDKEYFANLAVDAVLRLKVRPPPPHAHHHLDRRTHPVRLLSPCAGKRQPRCNPHHQEDWWQPAQLVP